MDKDLVERFEKLELGMRGILRGQAAALRALAGTQLNSEVRKDLIDRAEKLDKVSMEIE